MVHPRNRQRRIQEDVSVDEEDSEVEDSLAFVLPDSVQDKPDGCLSDSESTTSASTVSETTSCQIAHHVKSDETSTHSTGFIAF